MKARISVLFVFLFFLMGKSYAQDTSRPVIMTQHAYDSTLRALKKAAEAKQKDTLKQPEKQPVKDTVKAVAVPVSKDTADKTNLPQSDTSHKASVVKAPVLNPDTNKKNRVKYSPAGYLELAYDEAYPEGNYTLKGYPSKGGFTSFTAAFPGVVSHFGMIFKIGFGFNGLDKVRYMDSLKSMANNPNLGFSMDGGAVYYTYKTALFGLFYTYPLRKISIDARFLMGIMVAALPATTVNVFDYGNQNLMTINSYSVTGSAFALDEGISVRYIIFPLLSASLGIDNISAPTSFRIVGQGIAPNPYGVETQTRVQTSTIIQPFHLFTVNLGVCYTIRARRRIK